MPAEPERLQRKPKGQLPSEAGQTRQRLKLARQDRIARRVVLGALAVTAAIVWLAREFDMDRDELLGFLGMSLVFVAVPFCAALLGGGVLAIIRRWRR